jgi:hypothetical protein
MTRSLHQPVVMDGDYVISQSTAACYYLGKKLGLTPAGFDDAKAMQCLLDIQDLFEGNVGKNNEDGPTLKKFIEGPRFAALMGNLERAIKVGAATTPELAPRMG